MPSSQFGDLYPSPRAQATAEKLSTIENSPDARKKILCEIVFENVARTANVEDSPNDCGVIKHTHEYDFGTRTGIADLPRRFNTIDPGQVDVH
jgi:hypothetical protein